MCEAARHPGDLPDRLGTARFTTEVPSYQGLQVFDANPEVIRDLKARGLLVRHDSYDHAYPHCWRCATPLVYRAVSSWFVQVTAFRDRMVELNQQIRWVPEHVRDGSFGKWLENARDWSISRNRYWGSPMPVWKSDDPAYPPRRRLRQPGRPRARLRRGRHRPPPPDGRRPRAAQPRRPDRSLDDASRPRDARLLVRVGLDAVRPGALPVREHRVVRAPLPGRLHRRVHRPDPRLVLHAARAGHRAVRPARRSRTAWPTASCSATTARRCRRACATTPTRTRCSTPTAPTRCAGCCCRRPSCAATTSSSPSRRIRDSVRQVVLPLWNAWYFFSRSTPTRPGRTVTPPSAPSAPIRRGTLDRYLLAKLHDLVATVTAQMDAYDLFGACASVRGFLDVLTNWYIRRSRDRFWAAEQDAFDTLHTALHVLTRVAAPLLPLVTEEVYRGLTGEAQRAPRRLARRPTPCRPTPTSSRRWTRCARSCRRRCRSARPGACGSACRWRRSRWPRPTPPGSSPSSTSCATR